jgi:hypothetical protein
MTAVRPVAVGLLVGVIAFACDPSPTGVAPGSPLASRVKTMTSSTSTGLVACSQSYDSVTQVIGPKGGYFAVGSHYVYVDSFALASPVSITAVAPAGAVRWVRFQPDGLTFLPTVDGWSAALFTSYKDCGVPVTDTVRIAQVSDSLAILGYLQTYVKVKNVPWSQAQQGVLGLLQHFSNYAIAW